MRWNKRATIERPEYPKVVPITVTADQAKELLSSLQVDDPEAELVGAGERGLYVRVHNERAEASAKLRGGVRSFPLA